ncbi:MAG: hypothetical protein MAG715_00048 [Methanonatronarchaeales archaeon]|nr:hypothetical protein [Methanonatronarchaeales archaeon]
MVTSIPDREILVDLVQRAVEMERIAETSDIWKVYDATEDEKVKALLFDMKVQSEHHLHVLLGVAGEIGLDVDVDELERRAEQNRLIKEGMDLVDVLKKLRQHDMNCRDFYMRIAESLEASSLEDVDSESVAERFEYLSEYEDRHVERMSEQIERLQSSL